MSWKRGIVAAAGAVAASTFWKWSQTTRKRKEKAQKYEEDLNDDAKLFHRFQAHFSTIVSAIMSESGSSGIGSRKRVESLVTRIEEMIRYNCVGGKMFRGMLVVLIVRDICKKHGVPFSTRVNEAIVLGWCIEILHGGMLVADDIMDNSRVRRGQECWYLRSSVGMDAINDAFVLESLCYVLLKKYFGHMPEYLSLSNLFHDVIFKTELGQMLDLLGQSGKHRKNGYDLLSFEDDLYDTIICYKTALYTFHLPICAAMLLCGCSTEAMEETSAIALEMGKKFQIQDDWLDTFGDYQVMGKSGTDVKDHKCTWLIVQARKLVDAKQLSVLQQHYGEKQEESIDAVRKVFRDVGLQNLYQTQEWKSLFQITKLINSVVHEDVPTEVLKNMLKKMHLREK